MKGKVYLVGAGPGNYKLMTLRGLEAIKEADVIVYDRLINKEFLKQANSSCEFIYVGKESDNHTMSQENINILLAEKAREGKVVVRLKGGDPYVFGRGGEEGELLYEEGVDFEVVPGITSAIGGLCYAGIPITHRDYASSFHVITGHLKDDASELDWEALSRSKGTLVFLMGMSNLKDITKNLIENGKSENTPAAVINWATSERQKVATGKLSNIYEIAAEDGLTSPSLIVVGEVVGLRNKLSFFEKKPLKGKNIVVTRARAQSSSLVNKLEELGAKAIEVPVIKINRITPNEELDDAIYNIKDYSYLIFTSINGVNIFFQRVFELGFDTRILGSIKIVAIGRATSSELNKYSIFADIIPEKFVSEGIVEELKGKLTSEDNVFIPRAKEARSYLVEELRKLCFVNEIKTYETFIEDSEKGKLNQMLKDGNIDYITFTSSSTVNNFLSQIDEGSKNLLDNVKLISIGPITSETMRKQGLKVYKEAFEYNIDGIVNCILNESDVK